MKHLIIVIGTLLLGCYIFLLISGSDNSLKSTCASVISDYIDFYKEAS